MAMAQLQRFMRRDEDYVVPAIDDTAELPAIAPEDDDTATLRPVVMADPRMSYGRQSAEALRHAWQASRRRAREEHEREGSWLHRIATEPVTLKGTYVYGHQDDPAPAGEIHGTCDYAQARGWVPPGHDGGIAEKAGVLYFALIGRPKVAYHRVQIWKAERPLRWAIWNVIKFAIAMALVTLDGHGRLAAEITGGVLLAAVAVCAVLMPRRSAVGDTDNDDTGHEEEEGGDPE